MRKQDFRKITDRMTNMETKIINNLKLPKKTNKQKRGYNQLKALELALISDLNSVQ